MSQRVVVYRPAQQNEQAAVIWEHESVPVPWVVYASDSHEARDFATGQVTQTAHGAFIIEKMEASASVYFEANGGLRDILVSD